MRAASLECLSKLDLTSRPVAIAFLSAPPPGMARVPRAAAAGCGYWKHAADGHAFYTTAEDHYNCPVGAFTHGVELTPASSEALQGLVGTMIQLHYLRSDEVPHIPHRTEPMRVAAYAPLDAADFAPDLVVFRGTARHIMLLSEAARAAGAFDTGTLMGRPACAMLPQALTARAGVASVGCIGNRVYTGLGDDELYLAVPGGMLQATLDQIETIVRANGELEAFHRQRASALGALA